MKQVQAVDQVNNDKTAKAQRMHSVPAASRCANSLEFGTPSFTSGAPLMQVLLRGRQAWLQLVC
jgi:hypothetical protein